MDWFKHVLLDVAVTVLIVAAVTFGLEWARWIVLIYTPLMLILKILAFLGRHSLGQLKRKEAQVPAWFYHALFAANVVLAAGGALVTAGAVAHHWWMIAGGWVLIWILSAATTMQRRPAAAR